MPTVGHQIIRKVIFRQLSVLALNQVVSTRVIEDASFLRLKTLTLGYTIPAKIVKRTGKFQVHV